MSNVILYHMPGACSRVTLVALEEAGIDYEDRGVALARGAQRDPDYLALNSRGKVPTLVVDGCPITESAVILRFLATRYPEAGLLPARDEAVPGLVGLSDLVWCSGTLHPLAHRIFKPEVYTTSKPEGVRETAVDQLGKVARWVSSRIVSDRWWYGARWSIVDTYISWCFSVAAQFGFPIYSYPEVNDFRNRVEERPAFQRMQLRERVAIDRDQLPVPAWYS